MYCLRVSVVAFAFLFSYSAMAELNFGKLIDVVGKAIEKSTQSQETEESTTNNSQTIGGSSAPTAYGSDFPSAQIDELFAESTLDFIYSPWAGDDLVVYKVISGADISRDDWRVVLGATKPRLETKLSKYSVAYNSTRDTFKKEAVLDEYIQNFAIPRANVIKDKISRNEPFVLDATAFYWDGGGCDIEQWDYNKKAFPIKCTNMERVGLARGVSRFHILHQLLINQKNHRGFTNFVDQKTDIAVENALSNPGKFKESVDMYVVFPQSVKFDSTTKNIHAKPIYYRFTVFEVGKRIVATTALSASKDADKITDSIKSHCPRCQSIFSNKF